MWPRATSSTESAMTSRLMSEAFMPSVPMAMPSVTRDGVELDGRAARGAHALLHLLGQLPVIPVAGRDPDPAVGHADQRPRQVLVGEADGLEYDAGGGAVGAVEKGPALVANVEAHADVSSGGRRSIRYMNFPSWTTSPR